MKNEEGVMKDENTFKFQNGVMYKTSIHIQGPTF